MPNTKVLLPEAISSLIELYQHQSSNTSASPSTTITTATTTTTIATDVNAATWTNPRILREHLRKIPRSTWMQLGSEAHNTGFAAEMTTVLATSKAATSSVSMFSTAAAAAKAAALLTENGMPRIVRRIAQRSFRRKKTKKTIRQEGLSESQEGPPGEKSQQHQEQEAGMESSNDSQPRSLLLELYGAYKEQYDATKTNGGLSRSNGALVTTGHTSSSSSSLQSTGQMPWQLEFLRSGCPEVFIMVFLDCFLEYGPKHGYERDLPADLMEAIDFEWRTNSGPAKRAVLALIQTLITCRRYAKKHGAQGGSHSSGHRNNRHHGTAGEEGKTSDVTHDPLKPGSVGSNMEEEEAAVDRISHQLALTLSEACTALELFFETERGRYLPKLIALYQQEVAADTKLLSRSGQGGGGAGASGIGAGIDRGTKRQGYGAAVGGAGAGTGPAANTGMLDPMDPTGRKRLKSSGGTDLVLGSVEGSALGGGGSGLASQTGSSTATAGQGSLKDSSYYIEQALAGYPAALAHAATTTAITSTTSTSTPSTAGHSSLTMSSAANAQLQAKLNNPLWSPTLGVTHQTLFPVKHAVQVGLELERWISLLGHMDGAVFSDKLVGLIKAVYPSDQKFLLDQILIEYICWEGSGGSERDADVDMDDDQCSAFDLVQYLSGHGSSTTTTALASGSRTGGAAGEGTAKAGIRTGEWIMETIMSALVSLVIKPEESSTYLEPGSRKWIESMEIILQDEADKAGNLPSHASGVTEGALPTSSPLLSGVSSTTPSISTSVPTTGASTTSTSTFRTSAAMGGTKKRRVRSLYNRRVSPFYAILAMFQPRRVTGRVPGMLYLGPEDVETKKPQDEKEELLKQVAESTLAAGGVRKLTTAAGAASLEPIELEPDAFRIEKRRLKKKNKKYRRRKNGDLDAEEEFDPRQRSARTITKMDIDGQPMDADALLQAVGRQEHGDDGGGEFSLTRKGGGKNSSSHSGDKAMKEDDENAVARVEEDSGGKDESDTEGGDMVEGHPKDDAMEGVMEHEDHEAAGEGNGIAEEAMEDEDEDEEEDALALAKKAEAARTVCHAPFKVLLFILQYLTRVNQAGALDAWITDALSATLARIQVQYFEWILASLIVSTSTPSPATAAESGGENAESSGLLEDELLRLLGVLVVAQGIGYEPVKSASRAVESVYQGPAGEYWMRVRAMLEGQ
ncbi:MAG: hypothetical protein J3Q66DRAFT_335107 [Benniella sp.]|nr:MAG: hypothetical protein J3Q66DRAFT_335107 [Benniella sp.]